MLKVCLFFFSPISPWLYLNAPRLDNQTTGNFRQLATRLDLDTQHQLMTIFFFTDIFSGNFTQLVVSLKVKLKVGTVIHVI